MREILFRGKRVDNGEWIEGHYVRYGYTGKENDYIVPVYASDLYAIEVIPETVGQYTGLTDKNGTKIFEGDILRLKRFGNVECGKIVFNTDTAGFEFWREAMVGAYGEKSTRKENLCAFAISAVEIIGKIRGNIHDNPELLDGVRNG